MLGVNLADLDQDTILAWSSISPVNLPRGQFESPVIKVMGLLGSLHCVRVLDADTLVTRDAFAGQCLGRGLHWASS